MVIGATETGVQSRTLAYRTAPDPGGLRALEALPEARGNAQEVTVEETAEALHVSVDTVMRDWKLAMVWLREFKGQGR